MTLRSTRAAVTCSAAPYARDHERASRRARERAWPSGPAEGQERGAGGDASALVAERIDKLLAELDPASTDPVEFRGRQYDLGLAWVHFPEGSGGLGVPPALQRQVDERVFAAGAAPPASREFFGWTLAAPTVVTNGDEALRERLLRRMFTGEDAWCQLFSEPGAGSDLAGLATRAVRDGDEWMISGQKVWNTLAHIADRGMLVARTDPDVPKHKGLTYFALDMHAPGVEVRPLRQMTGEAEFNEVYMSEVRVPDADRIGDVGDGWRVAMTTLMNERTVIGGGGGMPRRGSGAIAEAVRIWQDEVADRHPAMRDRLMRLWIDTEVLRLTNIRASQNRKAGNPGPEGSIAKLGFAETNKAVYDAVRRPSGRGSPGRVRLHHAAGREPRARGPTGRGAQDVPALPGQLDRGRHVGDPAQHPR